MKLGTLSARGQNIAEQATQHRKNRVLDRLRLPSGVDARAVDDGIEISGRGLLRQFVTDDNFRNSIS